jgi:hypothetical protein
MLFLFMYAALGRSNFQCCQQTIECREMIWCIGFMNMQKMKLGRALQPLNCNLIYEIIGYILVLVLITFIALKIFEL